MAWDEITVSPEAVAAVAKAGAFIFGSLASRSPYNLEQLDRLLGVKGPLKFFDVNLRPPFVDPIRIVEFSYWSTGLTKGSEPEIAKPSSGHGSRPFQG